MTGGPADPPGFELPLRLFLGFRTLIDGVHAELARQGHPDLRPMHGFVLQAVGLDGTTAVELGRRLGVSKQAAGKTIDSLEHLGYLERAADPRDARRKIVRLTGRALDALARSAATFDDLRGPLGRGPRPRPPARPGGRPPQGHRRRHLPPRRPRLVRRLARPPGSRRGKITHLRVE